MRSGLIVPHASGADQYPRGIFSGASARSRPGRGLVLEPREGAYAAVPVCTPHEWLTALSAALSLPAVEAQRRRLRVAGPATILAAARVWAASSDRRTGRDVALAHRTVAAAIGYADATVKRIMRFLSRIGFIVECARGRNRLTLDELAAARQRGAHQQRAVASTRALTIPRSVEGTPLPLTQPVPRKSHARKRSPKRAHSARKVAASRRPAEDESHEQRKSLPRWPLAVQQLAAQLAARLPHLLRHRNEVPQRVPREISGHRRDAAWIGGRHIGHLCDAIARHSLTERGWTAQQLIDRLDQHAAKSGRQLDAAEQDDPLAWMMSGIQRAIAPDEIAPFARLHQERADRRRRQALAQAVDAERIATIATQRTEIDSIIAGMNQLYPPRSPRLP